MQGKNLKTPGAINKEGTKPREISISGTADTPQNEWGDVREIRVLGITDI